VVWSWQKSAARLCPRLLVAREVRYAKFGFTEYPDVVRRIARTLIKCTKCIERVGKRINQAYK
jgi:hypothetical protein